MNNTTPQHIQFVKKPVYSIMGLLSLLGDERAEVDLEINDPLISVLVTRSNRRKFITIAVVYANNTSERDDNAKAFNLTVNNASGRYAVYLVNNVETNPFLIWKRAGSPVFPQSRLRKQMRDAAVRDLLLLKKALF